MEICSVNLFDIKKKSLCLHDTKIPSFKALGEISLSVKFNFDIA